MITRKRDEEHLRAGINGEVSLRDGKPGPRIAMRGSRVVPIITIDVVY